MGFLTTIHLHNDALHEFEAHPEEFAKAVFDGIVKANRKHEQVSVGFRGYCNHITVEPSEHADSHQVYVHYGNTVQNINPFRLDIREWAERSPETFETYVGIAEEFVKDAKKLLDKQKAAKKE